MVLKYINNFPTIIDLPFWMAINLQFLMPNIPFLHTLIYPFQTYTLKHILYISIHSLHYYTLEISVGLECEFLGRLCTNIIFYS